MIGRSPFLFKAMDGTSLEKSYIEQLKQLSKHLSGEKSRSVQDSSATVHKHFKRHWNGTGVSRHPRDPAGLCPALRFIYQCGGAADPDGETFLNVKDVLEDQAKDVVNISASPWNKAAANHAEALLCGFSAVDVESLKTLCYNESGPYSGRRCYGH